MLNKQLWSSVDRAQCSRDVQVGYAVTLTVTAYTMCTLVLVHYTNYTLLSLYLVD